MILLSNADVFESDYSFRNEDVLVANGRILAVGIEAKRLFDSTENHEKKQLDLDGLLLLPGLIDIHIHGCAGFDTCDASQEALIAMSQHLAQNGVTSFLPTTMTLPQQELSETIAAVQTFMRNGQGMAKSLGVHVEGPYLSLKYAGIQSAEHIRHPSMEEFSRLLHLYPDIIRILDIAPELPGAGRFIQEMKANCTISFSHSDADYETAKESFSLGISHVTHLYNAMRGLAHRDPGAVGAVFTNDYVTAELICDGYHIHPAALRVAFRMLGEDRSVIVSDSMRAASCPDGVYLLGGQPVTVKEGRTTGANQRPAGSVTNILEEMRNLISFGIPIRQIIKSATINPARVIGMDQEIGSISIGKRADLIAVDPEFILQWTMIDGAVLPAKNPLVSKFEKKM